MQPCSGKGDAREGISCIWEEEAVEWEMESKAVQGGMEQGRL